MFTLGNSRIVAMLTAGVAMLLLALPANAAYSWGTRSVSLNGVVRGYSYGRVTGQTLQFTSVAYARRAGALVGRGVYAYVNAYQTGGAQYRSFRHPNTTGTSYARTTMTMSYSAPTYLTWNARGRTCLDIAWAPDVCGSYSAAGTIY